MRFPRGGGAATGITNKNPNETVIQFLWMERFNFSHFGYSVQSLQLCFLFQTAMKTKTDALIRHSESVKLSRAATPDHKTLCNDH